MSSGFDALWLAKFAVKQAAKGAHLPPMDAEPVEADLQDKIEQDCRFRLWPYARTRMDKKTTFTMAGVPDFIIAASRGRTLWIECKSKTGKQTVDQAGFGIMVLRQGGLYRVVHSFGEWLAVADGI